MSTAKAEPCEPGWAEGEFCFPGLNGYVAAAVSWEDGRGPALYAGGNFTTAGGVVSHRIAKWVACQPDPSCNTADFAEPFGVFDLSDLVAFVVAFEAGCP